ncbi:MAG: hypothetical protein JWN70_7019 [Planctomycetaceae bacterium]|nr:hypothetical protein [Planctomycetaceae bacterium]
MAAMLSLVDFCVWRFSKRPLLIQGHVWASCGETLGPLRVSARCRLEVGSTVSNSTSPLEVGNHFAKPEAMAGT